MAIPPQSRPPQSRPTTSGKPQSRTKSGSRWKPIRIRNDQVSIDGGYSNTSFVVDSLQICELNHDPETFVKVTKQALWFMKMVGGPETSKGQLRPIDVLDELREKILHLQRGNDEDEDAETITAVEEAAVAEAAATEERWDPMDALDGDGKRPRESPETPNQCAQFKKVKRGLCGKSRVFEVEMPRTPSCEDVNNFETVHVRAYLVGSTSRELWISTASLDWLLTYAAAQARFQGVVCQASLCATDEVTPNCAAVAGLRIDWNFTFKQWDAQFVAGPFNGATKSSSAADHTTERWEHMKSKGLVPQCELCESTPIARKEAAKQFLILWCEAIAQGSQGVFEENWCAPQSRKSAGASATPPTDECNTANGLADTGDAS
jgi:hypothetical protein